MRDTFEFELEKCGFTESDIRIIKSLISKYAPKEERDKDNVLLPAIIKKETDGVFAYVLGFKDGANLYRTELFREMNIK